MTSKWRRNWNECARALVRRPDQCRQKTTLGTQFSFFRKYRGLSGVKYTFRFKITSAGVNDVFRWWHCPIEMSFQFCVAKVCAEASNLIYQWKARSSLSDGYFAAGEGTSAERNRNHDLRNAGRTPLPLRYDVIWMLLFSQQPKNINKELKWKVVGSIPSLSSENLRSSFTCCQATITYITNELVNSTPFHLGLSKKCFPSVCVRSRGC